MSYDDLLSVIDRDLPQLKGQLHSPRVVYVKSQNKAYITFQSRTLVEEATFLKLEKTIRSVFPGKPLALRVVSPELGKDFLTNISQYQQVLVDFLRRNYPASASWMDGIDWKTEGDTILLMMPDEFSRDYMQRQGIIPRLKQAIRDIFAVDARVELGVRGDAEKQLEEELRRREEARAHMMTAEELRDRYHQQEMAAKQAEAQAMGKIAAIPGTSPEKAQYAVSHPIFGRVIGDKPVDMNTLTGETGIVTVQGDIFKMETKELKGGEMILLTFAITDYTSSILCKSFLRFRKKRVKPEDNPPPITEEERREVMDKLDRIKVGMCVKVRGECLFDSFAHENSITVRDMVPMDKKERKDTAKEKRVELHLHTQMSSMDALASASDLIGRAVKWGHEAIAVTDHGVLQAFPESFKAAKGKIKLIPGCEGYLIDEKEIVTDPDDRDASESMVVLDFEATGLNTHKARIIEIGAVKMEGGTIVDSMSVLVNPREPLKAKITELTGINDAMLADAPTAEVALPKLLEFIGNSPLAAHNSAYDASLLKAELQRIGLHWEGPVLDTLTLARKMYPDMKSHKLGTICKALGVSLKNAHRAVHDATATAQMLQKMLETLKEKNIITLRDMNEQLTGGAVGESFHIILLAKSQEGLVNLNKLVSISHLEHFRRRPHMMRREIQQHREGLIVGSACEAGELFRAVLAGESRDKLKKIARFYDYLEIQPIGNNAFLVRNGEVKDDEGLRDLNRVIVSLGEELGIPVVATGDVHFLDPHNAINRAIIQAGMGFEDCDNQPPLYFKTTDEMLEEFAYLGEEKCREVVIDNPKKIAASVADLRLFPKHPTGADTFQPVWEDAADNIQNMTWETAHELYGETLPEIVTARIEKELKSIVGYGFCTLYNIAQKLVSRSVQDGYLVGSRGSVGSSLVARLCGITEVNALPPHYRCGKCKWSTFDVDRAHYKVGVDLPDMKCPQCGEWLLKDGFDIPFEVFLGFEGDKVPDIDLNFSGEYQNRAHHYVEELFGKDHVFRAGTISTLQDKTAYGYVSKYLEERGISASNTEKDRLVAGCAGVKRSTGQHPGGMVVVPKEYDISQFTAVNHPADDLQSDFITTHFDFNSMHDILVKLDCLGHVDPTVLHYLKELTGIDYKDVPLDDLAVRSLFHSPHALGLSEDDILCTTGTYGIPEFGTGFVRGMLDDTRPSTMEELVRISGLSHGTDVWLGNAQDLITSGTATLPECVCCRDDIMNYLIDQGVKPKLAFTTMESVRKGKGLKDEMMEAMIANEVPQWFIDSCKKIKYLFPKGHAVAYVTMSLRVAWFKVHYPQAYYAAYFTHRGDGFNALTMLVDPDTLREKIREYRSSDTKLSALEKDQCVCIEIVLEMMMRGIRFLPVDLYKSEVNRFSIEDGCIRCPFTSLPGLGESAALTIVEAREKGPFISVEDLKDRGHASAATVELLRQAGSLGGMSETSQISMF